MESLTKFELYTIFYFFFFLEVHMLICICCLIGNLVRFWELLNYCVHAVYIHLHGCLFSIIFLTVRCKFLIYSYFLVLFLARRWCLILFQVILKFYDLRCRDCECPSNITFEEKCSILLDDSADNWSFSSDGGTSTLKYIVNLKPFIHYKDQFLFSCVILISLTLLAWHILSVTLNIILHCCLILFWEPMKCTR